MPKLNSHTILVVTWMGGGNVRPVLDMVRDLVFLGHHVHVLSNPDMEVRVVETGAFFHAFKRIPRHSPASPSTDIIRAYEGRSIGETNNIIGERFVFGLANSLCDDTLDLIDSVHPQALVADYVLLGAITAAEFRKLPYLVTSDGMYPLPGVQRTRSSSTYSYLFGRMVTKYLPILNSLRSTLHLPLIEEASNLYSSASRFLINTYPALGADPTPAAVIYAGPQFTPPPLSSATMQEKRRQPPLVLGSFSTIFTPEQGFFIERLTRALERLDVEAQIGTGSSCTQEIDSSSPRIKLHPYIPLSQLLPQSRLLVNHAGNGTIVRAMAAGVPQLCIPFLQDQHDYARRIAELGIGLTLPKTASIDTIESAVTTLLTESSFLAKAEKEQAEILQDHQPWKAARLIEEVICEHNSAGLHNNYYHTLQPGL